MLLMKLVRAFGSADMKGLIKTVKAYLLRGREREREREREKSPVGI